LAEDYKDDSEGKEVDYLNFGDEEITLPKKSYVPDGFDKVEDYLQDMRETYNADVEYDADNREAAIEDKKFAAGEQWDPVVLQQRQGLPCLTIDTISQFTAQLVGDWRQNRNGIKVLPAENGDKNVADVRSDIIRAIETRQSATQTYNNAFESMIQCGDGAYRIGVEYASEDVFDQEIVIQPIDDALSVVWDRLSVDPTGRDAKHCFVDDLIPRKEFDKRWPEEEPSILRQSDRRTLTAEGWLDSHNVRVTEHWRLIERLRMLVMFQDGMMYSFNKDASGADIEKMVQTHGEIVKSRKSPCTYAQMHLVTGNRILAGPYEWKLSRLPIIRMSGRVVSVGDRRVRYGLVRKMKDVVRLRNFWRSVAAEQLGYAPKAQWLATESAVEGREAEFRKGHLSRDPLLIANDEAIFGQNLMRIEPPPLQMALLNEAQVNTQDMKDVTGIHDASLGIKSNETSGRAIMARQREGDVASLTYYDNGNMSVLEGGDVINQLIGQIYDGTRIIRVIGEDEASKLVNINDPMDPNSPNLAVGKFDVVMTSGPSYTTRRVEAAEAMMEAVQVYPQMMEIAGDLVAKAQDWPGSEELAERLRKMVPPQLLSDKEKQEMGQQGPDQQQVMQQQAQQQEMIQKGMQELEKLKQENLVLKTKHDVELRKLVIEEFKAETDRLLAYGQFAAKDKEFELQQLEHHADMAMHEDEMELQENQQASDAQESAQPAE
jgi:hypothetical protein